MKKFKKILLFVLTSMFATFTANAQIKGIEVEMYYISDANDATDTTNGNFIDVGSKTYRVYVELEPNSKITRIYGDINHALIFRSSANFYNNTDRPTAFFGYLINKSWFGSNPTLGLDSWLTLGLATKTQAGVLKSDDPDGSIVGGSYNNGGSSGIAGGILVNADPLAGAPLTTSDGLLIDTAVYSQWIDNGFKNLIGEDSTAFGSLILDSSFYSNNCFLQQNSGVDGVLNSINKVLIGQFTTKGDLRFEINLEVQLPDSSILKYVANDSILLNDEVVSPFLKYPQACGCQDPKYLEYSAAYGCTNNDSCKTLIKFGCLDSLACNFDPEANFSIPSLCCYPGLCSDRDISLVCPDVNIQRLSSFQFELFPNPTVSSVNFKLSDSNGEETTISVFDAFGTKVWEYNSGIIEGEKIIPSNTEKLNNGLFLVRVTKGKNTYSKLLLKN